MVVVSSFAVARRQGLLLGVSVGILQALHILFALLFPTNAFPLPLLATVAWSTSLPVTGVPTLAAFLTSLPTLAALVASLVAFFAAGFRAGREVGEVSTGALAGLLTGIVSSLIGGIALCALALIDNGLLRRQGFPSMDVEGIQGILGLVSGVLDEAILGLIIGAVVGALGGLIGKGRTPTAQAQAQAQPRQSSQSSVVRVRPVDYAPSGVARQQAFPLPTPNLVIDQNAPRIYVSHSHKDNAFCKRLIARLRSELGSDDAVWYDARGGRHRGDEWVRKTEHEMRARTAFIVVLSPAALRARSVTREIEMAMRQHHATSLKIIPVLAQPCEISPPLRGFQSISFQPPASFESALQQLLVALRH